MKIVIEAEMSDVRTKELEENGYNISYPFLVNVSLGYGDKVIYGNGKIKTDERLFSSGNEVIIWKLYGFTSLKMELNFFL